MVAHENAAAGIQVQISSNTCRVTMLLVVQIWHSMQETPMAENFHCRSYLQDAAKFIANNQML